MTWHRAMQLRRQAALRHPVDGLHVHTDEIIITNGTLDVLNLCLLAVTQPGDAVIVESPTFYGALQSLEVSIHPREGIDLDALAIALQRHRPKACRFMTNFQNPLGSLMPDEKTCSGRTADRARRASDRRRCIRRALRWESASGSGESL